MSAAERVTLRDVEASDLEIFYRQQLDPEAIRMAAFGPANPRDQVAHRAHWEKILKAPEITKRTILVEGQVAGHVSCYPHEGHPELTYWLGRAYWGQGVATEAVARLLRLVDERPITARAAADNVGSLRVLQKCGFKVIGTNLDYAAGRGEATEEYLLRLDGPSTAPG